jgi:hypothetical protein
MANDKPKNNPHHEQLQADAHDLAQTISQSVTQALTQGNNITGVKLNITADGKEHVDLKHTDVEVKITAVQSNDATQAVQQEGANAVLVETTVKCGNGANAAVETVTQTITQDVDQVLHQANNITGVDLSISAQDKAHVHLVKNDFDVVIKAEQSNNADQVVQQEAVNTVVADADSKTGPATATVDDVKQTIDQDAEQEIVQSNTITGVKLTIDAGDKSHVNLNGNDFDTFIWANQSNDADQVIVQEGTNTVVADADGFKWGSASTDDVTQTIDQDASQNITQTNTITGVDLKIAAGDDAHANLSGNDFDTVIIADQSNDADQVIVQNAANTDAVFA